MPTKEEFLAKKPTFKIQVNGMYGSGKTHFGMTFPKVYYLGTEPGGLDILQIPANKLLLDNLVEYDYLLPNNKEELKLMYEPDKGAIYLAARKAKELQKQAKVETLFLDNLTYTAEKMWQYINTFNSVLSPKTGNLDLQSMYGLLRSRLYNFFSMEIVNFPGNVVYSAHLLKESEEAMEDKIDKAAEISPSCLGSFRNLSEGLIGASLYLDRELGIDGKTSKFVAYCQRTRAMGTTINAKNRYGLPVKVENVSYVTLMDAVQSK